jgi:hypothetical protein
VGGNVLKGDEAVHAGHCSRYRCVYGDPGCPVAVETLPGGRAYRALAALREEPEALPGEEFAVRSTSEDWVYALPRILPKALYGKRGTREAAEWHLRKLAGGEDTEGFEIVRRPVGPWEVVQ